MEVQSVQIGIPSRLSIDHEMNFFGAQIDIDRLIKQDEGSAWERYGFWTSNKMIWKFIPECTPHLGELWEAVAYSLKSRLKNVL